MPDLRLLIFDLEGTLLQPQDMFLEAIYGAIEVTRAEFEIEIQYPDEQEVSAWIGEPDYRIVQLIDANIKAEAAVYLRMNLNARLAELTEEGSGSLYDGAHYALEALKSAGLDIAITCNYGRDYLIAVLDYFDLYDYVDFSICIDDVGHTEIKWMLEDVLSNQQVLGSDAVFIGDRGQDIAAAHQVDIRAVSCTWGFGSEEELVEADYQVNSLYELVELFNKES